MADATTYDNVVRGENFLLVLGANVSPFIAPTLPITLPGPMFLTGITIIGSTVGNTTGDITIGIRAQQREFHTETAPLERELSAVYNVIIAPTGFVTKTIANTEAFGTPVWLESITIPASGLGTVNPVSLIFWFGND